MLKEDGFKNIKYYKNMIYTIRIIVDFLYNKLCEDNLSEEFLISFRKKEDLQNFIKKRESIELDDYDCDLILVEILNENEYDKNNTSIFENMEDAFFHYINFFKERVDYNFENYISIENYIKKYKIRFIPVDEIDL